MNKGKPATNREAVKTFTVILGATKGYKYLGVTENRKSEVMREAYERIKKVILERVGKICKTGLNGKNTIAALNEYALSVINYYVGIIQLKHEDYSKIDEDIRKLLRKYKLHL